MEHEWWYADAGQRVGPVQLPELLQRLASDQIRLETLVWQPGWKDWRKLMDVEEIRTQVLEVSREQRHRNPPPFPPNAAQALDSSPNRSSSPITGTPSSEPAEPSVSQVRPWTRFWARLFDISVFGFIFGVVSVLLLPLRMSERWQELLFGMLVLFVWTFVEPVLLSSFGTTPGKWLLRIRLTTTDGQDLSYARALSRSLKVWWRGMGIGFPFVALFTMSLAAGRLRKNGITSWDKEGAFSVKHERVGWLRAIGMALVMLVFFVLQAIGNRL